MHDPVEITLKLRSPREVLTLVQGIEDVVTEAEDIVADDKRGDGEWMNDVQELRDAIWACLRDAGFELKYYSDNHTLVEVSYKGRDLMVEGRMPKIEPVLKGRVVDVRSS